MFSDVYRCHEQAEFDRWFAGGLAWETPGGTTRMRPLCASSRDMGFQRIQRFDFDDAESFRAWLSSLLAESSARSADADALARVATRALTLVTCGSDLAGQRERTLVTFVGA